MASSRSGAARRGMLDPLHLSQHLGGFGLERCPLCCVVFFRILAGAVFEVQVAEVLIEDRLLLFEKIEAGLHALCCDGALRVEDIDEERDGEDGADGEDHSESPPVSRRMRCSSTSRLGSLAGMGMATARGRQRRTMKKTPPMPSSSTMGGTNHEKRFKPVNIGAAKAVGPYWSWKARKMVVSSSP